MFLFYSSIKYKEIKNKRRFIFKAGRILKGQLFNQNGEDYVTTMESMDFTAISKVIIS